MTGEVFKRDESALRKAEQKPRLNWGRDVWISLVAHNHLKLTLTNPRKNEGDIIGAYLLVALAAAILIFRMWRQVNEYLNRG